MHVELVGTDVPVPPVIRNPKGLTGWKVWEVNRATVLDNVTTVLSRDLVNRAGESQLPGCIEDAEQRTVRCISQ